MKIGGAKDLISKILLKGKGVKAKDSGESKAEEVEEVWEAGLKEKTNKWPAFSKNSLLAATIKFLNIRMKMKMILL